MATIGQAAIPSRNLDKMGRVDMTSVSFLRNEWMPPTGDRQSDADGQS